MKGVFGVILGLVLVASLAGCARIAGGSGGAAATSPSPESQAGTGALPATMQLAVGILKLEDGDLAVDGQQAAELLPLWKSYLALSRSDTAVDAELEAIVVQIRETISPEQARAIADMQLTAEDMADLMQELGVTAVGAGRGAGSTGGTSDRQDGFAGGGVPPGGFAGGVPGGAGGMPAGAPGVMPGGQGSDAASNAQQAAGMRMAAFAPLIEALIKLLESKV